MNVLRFAIAVCVYGTVSAQQPFEVSLRYLQPTQAKSGESSKSGEYTRQTRQQSWQPDQTAIIVCDMWDSHHCYRAVQREKEFAPRLNEVLNEARQRGVTIIHAPSSCMDAYAEHPARQRALAADEAQSYPEDIAQWCYSIPAEEAGEYPIDQSDGGEDDTPEEHERWEQQLRAEGRDVKHPWKRQIDILEIDAERDFISDQGKEIWNVLQQRGIKNVVLAGVHTNMCVLGRPFGLRRLATAGKNVVLMRDMTDTMYNPAARPFVDHFAGTELIIDHIERFVCPTITSDQFIGGVAFRFQDDPRRRPNIVVILVDDMGYGDPGCFNPQSKIPTPNIDSLAADGMRFTDAHAPGPLCHMSRYGLLTGQYPFRIDVSVWPKKALIQPDQMTIASLAKQQGYQTAMVGKWHVGFDENGYENRLPGGPVDRGFDRYFGIRASTDIPPYFYIRNDRAVMPPSDSIAASNSQGWSPIQGKFWRAGGIAPDLKLQEVLPRFTDEAIQVIEDRDPQKPLMLYLAYPAPHTPWLPSEEFVGRSGAGLYGDFMSMVDAEIGRVLAAIRDSGANENTLVVFTSDNGPTWYDTDAKRFSHDSSGGFRGMKADAWEAGHRMPLIVRWPAVVARGSTSDRTICFTDLLATFAGVMARPLPVDAGPDSYSFSEVLRGGSDHQRRPVVMRAGSVASMMVIRSGIWKLITGLGSGGFSQPKSIQPTAGEPNGQLYNLADDPGETNNVYLAEPEIVKRLEAELAQIMEAS